MEQELIHFPHGEYADQVDALAHAAREVQKIGGPPVTAPVEEAVIDLEMDLSLAE